MSKKRFAKVSVVIWNDLKFHGLSSHAKLIFLHLLTTQHLTLLGLVPVQKAAIASACGLSMRQFTAAFEELIEFALIDYDDAGLVWLHNFFKHNSPDNSNMVLAWGHASDLCPECCLKERVLTKAGEYCLKRGDEFLRAYLKVFPEKGSRIGIGIGSTNGSTDKKQKSEDKEKSKEVVVEESRPGPRLPFPYHALPDSWRDKCSTLRPDVDPNALFEKVLMHYTVSSARAERRTADEWAKTWLGWVKKELT